jgi:hypothetical protein
LNRVLAASFAAAAAPISGKGAFAARIMAGVAYMALSIPRLVPMEVVERLRTALRQRSIEAAGAVKPRAGSNKHPASKPIGPIVAIRSAVIWLIVEVPIRAPRRHSDADGNLRRPQGYTAEQGNCEN